MSTKKRPRTSDKRAPVPSNSTTKGFSAAERAAMKERLRELKSQANQQEGEAAVQAKIAEMPESDRGMAERVHALVKAAVPGLAARTWYGMPAYAKDGKVMCFFQSAQKFKSRYCTFGFTDAAKLDDGAMWATAFALKELGPAEEARLITLIQRAAE